MDPLTHALSGALLARASASRHPPPDALPLRLRLMAGFTAALFPDIDFALRLFGTLAYLNWHQGLTHSLPMLPLWAFLLAHLFARISGGRHHWRSFFAPACLGLAIHIVGDLITAYGLMLFAPFSGERWSLPLAFVIDAWITGIITAGLLAAFLFPRRRHLPAVALIVLGMYVGFLATQYKRALDAAEGHAMTLTPDAGAIQALPQPLSPLHWKLIVTGNEQYHVARVRLAAYPGSNNEPAGTPWAPMAAAYLPVAAAPWQRVSMFGGNDHDVELARKAWHQPAFADFRLFAVFPFVDRIDRGDDTICVWFLDLRFVLPAIPPSFRFGSCVDAKDGEWHLRRERGALWID
jgi:inner membrane protein